jgi:hypothetical protein
MSWPLRRPKGVGVASIDKKANGRWKARYRSPDGRSRAKTFRTKSEATRFLIEKEHSKGSGS